MKKFLSILLLISFAFCLSACAEPVGLTPYVSELRSNLYQGESGEFTLKGGYGFKETPYQNDGKVGDKQHILTLKLIGKETSQTTYTASLDYSGQRYSATFKLSPVSHALVATLEIENFDLSEFTLNLKYGDKTEIITMRSIVPKGTIDYKEALSCLETAEPQLIKAFSDSEGNFNAEIYIRIIVKNEKAYWYVGLAGGDELLKALLIDGATGKVLAIREII